MVHSAAAHAEDLASAWSGASRGVPTLEARATLQEYEEQLDPARFARIHRATIVNLDFVRELRPWFRGDYLVQLTDGTELKLSRHYRASLADRFATRW